MMDFEQLAQQRQQESLARTEQAARDQQERIDEAARIRNAMVRHFKEKVIPTLEEAQAALDKTGVSSTINSIGLEQNDTENPYVTFWCGSVGDVAGEVQRFQSTGGMLHLSNTGSSMAASDADQRKLITAGVDRAISSYYRAVELRGSR